jgi:FAD dependent monooxygenase
MTCEYACVFGISTFQSDDPELALGSSHMVYSECASVTCIVGNKNRKFWLLYINLGKKHTYPDIPRYSDADVEAALLRHADIHITKTTRMRDLANNAVKRSMLALEEAAFECWYDERFCIIGDAAHKVTPHAGLGGNTAIESAAALVNLICDGLREKGPLAMSCEDVGAILEKYQNTRNKRVAKVHTISFASARLQGLESYLWRALAVMLVPLMGEEFEVSGCSDLLLGGAPLRFIPYKGRNGIIPWDGWSSQSMADKRTEQLPAFPGLEVSSVALISLAVMALAAEHLGLLPWTMNRLNVPSGYGVAGRHNKLETILQFLNMLPWGTIGMVELLRFKNRLLLPLM